MIIEHLHLNQKVYRHELKPKRSASMKVKLSQILFLFLICFCNPITFAADNKPNTKTQENAKSQENVILIQTATAGSIEKDKSKNNLFKITLNKVNAHLSYVADRPNRDVGKISLEKYLSLWESKGKNSFLNNPPNAIIHVNHVNAASSQSAPSLYTFELSKPEYNQASDTLIYQAKSLAGDAEKLPEAAHFKHMTLIIDDVCIGCWD